MPAQSLLDRISRIVMLVLAGMVTLSVVGVIEAIPRGAMQDRASLSPRAQQQPQREPPRPDPQPAEQQPQPVEQPQPEPGTAGASGGGFIYGQAAPAPAAPGDEDIERWLEAITYALMALVGLLALAAIILWRSLRERRRIADALEALSFSQRT